MKLIIKAKTLLRPFVKNRKTHLYCVGMERTGTTSVCQFFPWLRTSHEPKVDQVWGLIKNKHKGKSLYRSLWKRDWKLYLDVESNHLLAYLAGDLQSVFPNSLYLLTVREPMSWLESVLRWEISRPSLPDNPRWKPILDFYYGPKDDYQFSEMKRQGLYPIKNYLEAWNCHNQRVIEDVPSRRLFTVWTEELSERASAIADFAGLEEEPQVGQYNASSKSINPFKFSDRSYAQQKAEKICGNTKNRIKHLISEQEL